MKPGKKLFCRTVQLSLRAALPLLPYRSPTCLDSVAQVPGVLKREGVSSVLLITDNGVRSSGITAPLEALLRTCGIRCIVYDETASNPTEQHVEAARSLYVRHRCGALIGFGGGSSMDCAKAVGARVVKHRQSLRKMAGLLRVHHRLPPLIAIPTTSGTGSETTLAAVITDSETHCKYPIEDFCLIPHYAVLDPEVTRSLPPYLTACTAMDALTHAIEAYIGRSTTKDTRADALEAVRLIFASLDRAVENGDDMDARRELLRGAYLAGRAFTKSYVGYVHAVAHSLSGMYNVPHGETNAILLPGILEAYGPCIHGKLARLARAAGLAGEDDAQLSAGLIAAIRDMDRRFGIPETVHQLRREDIPALARMADREGNPLYPVPVLLDAEELAAFYELVMEDTHEYRRTAAAACRPEEILCRRKDPAGVRPAEGPAGSADSTGAA